MTISADDVKNLAHLSRLSINDAQVTEVTESIGDILALIDQLKQADTSQVTPLSHPLDQTQRLRVDEVTEHNQREKFQAIAPATEAGLYLVPQVID